MAVRFPSAEEPDGASGLGYLESEDTNLAAGGIIGHEWRCEAILLCHSVKLLCAWFGKGALGDGVVATVELKVDEITDGGSDHLGIKDESRGTSLVRSDDDSDISGESGDNTSEGGDGCSGELHV